LAAFFVSALAQKGMLTRFRPQWTKFNYELTYFDLAFTERAKANVALTAAG
jgi:hypothetical protein